MARRSFWFCLASSLLACFVLVFVSPANAKGSVFPLSDKELYRAWVGDIYGDWATSKSAASSLIGNRIISAFSTQPTGVSCGSYDTVSLQADTYTITNHREPEKNTNFGCPPAGAKQIRPINFDTMLGKVCPENSSGSPIVNPTSCTCNVAYRPNNAVVDDGSIVIGGSGGSTGPGTSCVPDCNAREVVSSGYYDIGTSAGAGPLVLACKGNCEVSFDGESPAGSALVGGQKHWFAKGQYISTGGACKNSSADRQIGSGSSERPPDSCGANQGSATMNGKTICADQGGDGKTTTPDSKDKETEETEKKTVTNPDGSTTTTETKTKIDARGNKETTVTTETTGTDGKVTTKTETTSEPKSGSEDGSEDGEEPEKSDCEKNPSGEGCGGDPSAVSDLYTPKQKTLATVLMTARDTFMGSAVGQAVGGFFVVNGGGGCPTWTASIAYLKTSLTIDQFCSPFAVNALLIFKTALLLVASFFAFRIAIE